ncbi:Hypothetical predicted protein [Mytilus galloprovincialis]|uniref:Reverse transcriptase domain-containing protein n=1 Tax=Mytilus galloprovincialis TaxID=29158 RepID=A0A8B6DHN5_MYTGA|nr:Hypothetical predicted protein [Mytilus galloprovincialis]
MLLSRRNDSDRRFRSFIDKHKLGTLANMGTAPTYQHGKGSSQIDYIFSHTVDNLLELEICHQHPTNTSSHVPVVGKIKATLSLTCAKSIKPPERRRNLWKDCDIEAYQSTLSNSQIPIIERPDQIKTFIDQLNGNILAAAKIAVPSKKIRLKGPKWKASPALRQLLVKGNLIHKNWIQYGRPTVNHPIIEERRSIKRRIRSQQRQDMACERKQFYNQIVESGKSTNFYKLIRRGLSNTISKPQGFMNEGQLILDLDKQSKGFARFYEDLAVPKQLEQFDSDYHENTQFNLELIRKIVLENKDTFSPITPDEVKSAIYKLNNNKSSDEYGICAEHLKLASSTIFNVLSVLFNAIIEHCYIPLQFLSGIITPVHKKGKDATDFGSYRGITVSYTIGKVFEHVILDRIEDRLPLDQSSLQFGFTKHISILLAALLINECIVEAKEFNLPLFIAFLDSQRAFDVVDHPSLKCKLFLNGICCKIWNVIDTWYTNLTSRVKWCGRLSDNFPIKQGVRQGGILSTGLYKTYINDLLKTLERNRLGMHIGTTYIGCPTVADDIALVANSATDLQLMLNVANSYANREKYVIHPEKSTILMKIPPKRSNTTSSDWKLGDNEVSVSKTTTHLGIIRSEKNEVSINIDDRISCATKTLYSLTGTGFHGTNGLPPTTCMKLFITYVLPRLLYGLETFVLKQYHLNALEKFYINFLRKIQCLPNRSVKGITYLLLGVRPATAELHIRQLNLLGCIIRSENLTLNKILRRQISTKSETSDSWFTYIDKLLVQYDLPSAAKMVINPPCKLLWKKNVKLAIDKFWTQKLLLDCQNKSTLSYCDLSSLKIGTVHKLWSSIESNIKDVRRGGIKARLITGTYVLQSNTSKFNQHEVSSVCPLCQYEDEDIVHFILKCNALYKYRKSYIEELEVIINSISNPNTCSWNSLVGDFGLLTQLILDPSVLIKQKILSCSEKTLTKIEDCSRKICFSLHCGRSLIINSEH